MWLMPIYTPGPTEAAAVQRNTGITASNWRLLKLTHIPALHHHQQAGLQNPLSPLLGAQDAKDTHRRTGSIGMGGGDVFLSARSDYASWCAHVCGCSIHALFMCAIHHAWQRTASCKYCGVWCPTSIVSTMHTSQDPPL